MDRKYPVTDVLKEGDAEGERCEAECDSEVSTTGATIQRRNAQETKHINQDEKSRERDTRIRKHWILIVYYSPTGTIFGVEDFFWALLGGFLSIFYIIDSSEHILSSLGGISARMNARASQDNFL